MIQDQKRLSREEMDKVELELLSIFKEVDISEIINQLRALREMKQELADLQQVLETAKCCMERVCNKKGWCC